MPVRAPIHRPRTSAAPGASDRDRGSAASRGYDHRWRQFRDLMLSQRPLCQDCEQDGRATAANEVHHIQKLRHRPDLRLDPNNVRCLCTPCHSRRTARGE